MNSNIKDNQDESQAEDFQADEQQSVRRVRLISTQNRQEDLQDPVSREGKAVPKRRTKISPIPKSEYKSEEKSEDFDPRDQVVSDQKLESSLRATPAQREKVGGFLQKIPDVLKQEEKREKRRFTAMLEPETLEFLQELKATRKIRSVSGLLEAALEEFFLKYNLK